MHARSWRGLALASLVLALIASNCKSFYRKIGGNFTGAPYDMTAALSPEAKALLQDALSGIETFVDYHVHLVSARFHPDWLSWRHPIKRARTKVYLSASGVNPAHLCDGDALVEDYLGRLLDLVRAVPRPGRYYLYALDAFYHPDGRVDWDRTPIYVPNDLVVDAAERHPRLLVPVVSVHPYRTDAIDELARWAGRGCRHVKWLPNSMGIDPSDARLDPFYAFLRDRDMVLLSHTGKENALEAEDQQFGNPLLLRRPLDRGVKVVALHAASEGHYQDLESRGGKRASGFKLLLRLLEDPRYAGRLFADTSCLTFYYHLDEALRSLLDREELQERFVHGSDYPFPAVNMALRTSALVARGFISEEERRGLNEIYGYNPLLFDFVVKRTVRHPTTGKRLGRSVFTVPDAIR